MIVIVGSPAWRPFDPAGPAGLTCAIAAAAAIAGSSVELVGRIGDDAMGDALLIGLSRAGVGHVAVLRDPAQPTSVQRPTPDPGPADVVDVEPEPVGFAASLSPAPRLQPADVALGLSYLTSYRVLVVTDDVPPEVIPACVDGAAFAGASLVVLVPEQAAPPDGLPTGTTVLATPADAEGAFAALVGGYAAAVDAGTEPAEAFRAATASSGWAVSTTGDPV
jgi:hypothetical protein